MSGILPVTASTVKAGSRSARVPDTFLFLKKTRCLIFAGGLDLFVREFVAKFPAACSHSERVVLIDSLIHRFHWESDGVKDGRPGATSLIQGRMKEIMEFLDCLSYGDNVPPELEQTREEWRRKWRDNAWSKGKGQG